ncbi:hypothetical protein JTE90_000699 [Oedothorax gibbosus]|uniref:G-protein coupled receptors family 1 profile domain-containing protein n=1 Tax=Oedothorax gibbosus TaxID=931172 RepID=A0AAV6UND3_9ARAC|nr:hypothetical protein JTE90_000699 [Oedothorax gibbosus]
MNITYWNNYTDGLADIDEYLAAVLGPKRVPLNWLMPLTLVYSVVFTTGLIGNTCTCLVIASNPYMQTATNCYLFNLAVADMLTLIFAMPLELYSLWHQYPWQLGSGTCILRTVLAEATAYVSILTIVTFSCEQYYAVCHPLQQNGKSKVARAFRNIVIIWLVSVVGAAPYGLFTKVNYLTLEPEGDPIPESAWCGFPFTDPDRQWETLMLCSTFFFFAVPMTLITALYFRISLTLYRASKSLLSQRDDGDSQQSEQQRARIRSRMVVIKMLMTVVIAFFVCWAPYHSQRLLFLYVSLYGEWTETLRKVNQDLFSLAGCFYYFNSTINPILYSVMSNRFRVAFREKLCAGNPCTCLLCCCCCCWRRWRDYFQSSSSNRVSSSASSSHHAVINPAAAILPPSNNIAAILPPSCHHLGQNRTSNKYFGQSRSEEKRREFDESHYPKFSSEPNFSMKVANRFRDLSSTTDDSNYYLARDGGGSNSAEGDCLSCVSCNSVFAVKPKTKADSSNPRRNKSSTSGDSQKFSTHEESEL